MGRFARAEGSKGSNKREEEDATPWSVMVQQVKGRTGGVEDEDEDFVVNEEDDDDDDMSDDKVVNDKLLDSDGDSDSGVDNGVEIDTSLLDQSDDDDMSDKEMSSSLEKGNLKRTAPTLISSEEPKKKKRKKSQKCKVCGEKGHWKKDCEKLPEERRQELQDLFTMKVERKGKGTGRKKNKNT